MYYDFKFKRADRDYSGSIDMEEFKQVVEWDKNNSQTFEDWSKGWFEFTEGAMRINR